MPPRCPKKKKEKQKVSACVKPTVTHLDNGLVQADLAKELNALLLGGVGEGKSSLGGCSLVGNENSGEVESAGLGGGSGGSSGSHGC